MVALNIEETSGVDHPAHLDEGWLVIKEAPVPEESPEPTVEELNARIAELEAQIAAVDSAPDTVEEPVEELVKAAPEPVAKAFADLTERVEKAEALVKQAEDERITREAVEFTKSLRSVQIDADVVKELRAVSRDLAAKVEGVLKAVDGQLESADIFKEIGSNSPDTHGQDRLEAVAKSLLDSGKAPTIQQARALAVQNDPSIYTEMKG